MKKYLLILLLLPLNLFATTILPYEGFEELTQEAHTVCLVTSIYENVVEVQERIKGPVSRFLRIRRYADNARIWGDVYLETGKTYLLFTDQNFRPICLSYYVYEDDGDRLKSLESANEITVLGASTVGSYDRDSLLNALRGLVNELEVTFPEVRKPVKKRSADHCTWLGGSNPMRWEQMPVALFCNQDVLNEIQILNATYQGIDYIYGGPHDFVPDCSDGTSIGTDYVNWLINNNSRQYGVIFLEDPCEELLNLNNCAGTLAVGGIYGSGSHNFGNQTWTSAAYPFVIMNNDVSMCSSFSIVLQHEITHTMGIGHISSSFGAANMNPFCCSEITHLDIECLDFTYPPECAEDNMWMGGFSNLWEDAPNWSLGVVPDSCHHAVVPFGSVISNIPSYAKTLEVQLGAEMLINSELIVDP